MEKINYHQYLKNAYTPWSWYILSGTLKEGIEWKDLYEKLFFCIEKYFNIDIKDKFGSEWFEWPDWDGRLSDLYDFFGELIFYNKNKSAILWKDLYNDLKPTFNNSFKEENPSDLKLWW